ncbi:MAG: PD-(D/E)XK nuclease family protein [Flavobacteriaceae bacterium]
MANSFLGNVVQSLKAQQPDWGNMCFVLPNRRAQHFLLKELTVALEGPLILPQSYSIDDFVVAISMLKPATDLEQQQALYQSYCASTDKKDKPNSFETFLGWSTPLLKDLNTIDQYLVDRKDFFSYMSSLHEIRAWGQAQNKIIQDYTAFWKRLPDIYHEFMHRLEESGQTTPGMCYRMSTELLETFLQHNSKTQFVFCGFNALSPSEIFIVRELLTQDRAQVFWDIDKQMLDDELDQAGRFIRSYISTWPEYKQQPFNQAHAHFHDSKSIKVIQVQQQLGQAKEIGDILAKMDNQQDWSKTAVVLADESLLMPLLYALPPSIDKLNITMGFPLDQHPTAIFINALLKMAVHQTGKGFYFADVESVLSIPETKTFFLTTAPNLDEVLEQAKKEHRSYLDTAYIKAIVPKAAHASVDTLFRLNGTPNQWIADMLEILPLFHDVQQSQAVRQAYSLAVEKLMVLLSQIKDLASGLHQDFSFSLLRNLYSQLSAGQKLNFAGSPLEGLQILGVLETRAIDFDNVLVAGVNEGILPGQSEQPSWIPYEVRKAFGLPTQDEQDAIFTYHFYRLMYRASKVKLFYNGTTDGVQVGEPSRFIRQWAFDCPETHSWQEHTQNVPFVPPPSSHKSIPKTPAVMEKLLELAKAGFSPSGLNVFVKDGYAFYKRYLLGLREEDELETYFSHKTYGTLTHNCLEALYMPYVGKQLSQSDCKDMIDRVDTVADEMVKLEHPQNISGKNVLALAAIKRNIQNIIAHEQGEIEAGNVIEIVALEQKLSMTQVVPGIEGPVTFKGTVDRVDKYNGTIRVLDYKTGQLQDLGIMDWTGLVNDPDRGQARQLLMYAMLWNTHNPNNPTGQAGIIAIKQYKKGVLYVGEKASARGKVSPTLAAEQIQKAALVFEELTQTLFDPNCPFSEPEA